MAYFTVNALQVNLESVLSMDNAGMVKMFKSLEESGMRGFLGVSGSVFEGALIEFFANAKVIVGTIVSTAANWKMVVTKDLFREKFQLPTEGMVSFSELPTKAVAEMKVLFSVTGVPLRPLNKKKDIKVEYQLLHDIVAKSLCAKAGSFDVVTSENFEMMVAINSGLKVNWGHILFQTLVAMVYIPGKQSQGFVVPLSILLEKLVKEDLGDSLALHPLKVLNNKSVLTYMKKNQAAPQAGKTSKQLGDTASENKFTADGL
ncbi:hypothetical protein F511_32157 [Dorcoceras hygrometricum]|uniref:Dystroglycan-like n=1 Tax=Dorcoceras hygrometricum TaxID=472368 RepID=A0A2Z7A2W7_9LAMI|nr:hypothetical protein F511_32157 [Dorcoceras hygrometricum]